MKNTFQAYLYAIWPLACAGLTLLVSLHLQYAPLFSSSTAEPAASMHDVKIHIYNQSLEPYADMTWAHASLDRQQQLYGDHAIFQRKNMHISAEKIHINTHGVWQFWQARWEIGHPGCHILFLTPELFYDPGAQQWHSDADVTCDWGKHHITMQGITAQRDAQWLRFGRNLHGQFHPQDSCHPLQLRPKS